MKSLPEKGFTLSLKQQTAPWSSKMIQSQSRILQSCSETFPQKPCLADIQGQKFPSPVSRILPPLFLTEDSWYSVVFHHFFQNRKDEQTRAEEGTFWCCWRGYLHAKLPCSAPPPGFQSRFWPGNQYFRRNCIAKIWAAMEDSLISDELFLRQHLMWVSTREVIAWS